MENSTFVLPGNTTYTAPNDAVMQVFKVIFTLILVMIMFGMGCAVDYKKLIENLKRPVGISVGLCCQIIIMPTLTFALIKIFRMDTVHAIAFMLLGCSPGGNNSNVITYLIRGDISLSVAMTSFSNVLALGTVPLWMFIFTSIEHIDDNLQIPHSSLVIGLLSIIIPVAVGIGFRHKLPKHARYIPKVCAIVAIIMLIVTIAAIIVVTKMPFVFSTDTFLPVGLLPLLGMTIAYSVSCIPQLKLSRSARKAIALETAIQNGGLANSVLVLTFGDRLEMIGRAVTIPLLYQIAQAVYMLVLVAAYPIWWRCKQRNRKAGNTEQGASGTDQAKDDREKAPLNSKNVCEAKEPDEES